MPKDAQPDIVAPTPERMRRGVELIEQKITHQVGKQAGVDALLDDEGDAIRAYRSIDILAAMERRGAITAEMRQAGEDFQTEFRIAGLDPLKAADYSRPCVSGSRVQEIRSRVMDARESVWQAVLSVGGPGSAGGSCLWNVVGWQLSLKEWRLGQSWSRGRVSQEVASGILIAVLGTLAAQPQRK